MQRTATLPHGRTLTCTAILHKIGTQAPYFSLTGEEKSRTGRLECCGTMHSDILAHWPDLAPLAALHLSSMDGAPTHAEENGWWWLKGAAPGLFKPHNEPRQGPEECLRFLAEHLRISATSARGLVVAMQGHVDQGATPEEARKLFSLWVDAQRPRWALEAAEAIQAFGLEVTR